VTSGIILQTRREVCPPVYETGKEHNGHVQYCKQDSECDRGQFCCFFGDTDAKICRLGVPKEVNVHLIIKNEGEAAVGTECTLRQNRWFSG